MKKSQVSLFVIIGVVILVVISMFVFIRLRSSKTEIKREAGETIDFSNVRTNVKLYVDDCLEQTTMRAIDNYGLQNSETQIENYINIYLISCLNRFEYLREQDYNVNYGSPNPTVEITDNVLFVDLVFPVTISKDGKEVDIKDFQHKFRTTTHLNTEGGVLASGTTLFTEDKDFVLTAEDDVIIRDADGNIVDSISVRTIDKEFDGLHNGVVIGQIAYEGSPNGATFDPPLKVTVRIKKTDLPRTYSPSDPMVGWYDSNNGIWRTYASLPYKQDDKYYYYSALVDHFTAMAVVACGVEELGTYIIPMGDYVFKHLIEPTEDSFTYWLDNKIEGGAHLIPELMGNATCVDGENMQYNFEGDCQDLIKDWDEDDQQAGASNYNIDIFVNDNGEKVDIDGDEHKSACYEKCKSKAEEGVVKYFSKNLPEKWRYDPRYHEFGSLVSGDWISNDAVLKCEFGIESKEENGDSVTYIVDDSDVTCIVPQEFDNIKNTESIGGSIEGISSTMETENKFYATPMTYGYEVLPDSLFNGLEFSDTGDVGGYGEFFLELRESGGTCIQDIEFDAKILTPNEKEVGTFTEGTIIEKPGEGNSCSPGDNCLWTLNEDENMGQLKAGLNTFRVKVANTWEDPIAWARGLIKITGAGLVKFEECGTNIQDRIEYLCKCKGECDWYGSTEPAKELNCLATYRRIKEAEDPDIRDKSLCDYDHTVEGLPYYCSEFDYSKESESTHGGRCENGKMICPDVIDENDIGCTCGDTVTDKPGYCCHDIFVENKEDLPETGISGCNQVSSNKITDPISGAGDECGDDKGRCGYDVSFCCGKRREDTGKCSATTCEDTLALKESGIPLCPQTEDEMEEFTAIEQAVRCVCGENIRRLSKGEDIEALGYCCDGEIQDDPCGEEPEACPQTEEELNEFNDNLQRECVCEDTITIPFKIFSYCCDGEFQDDPCEGECPPDNPDGYSYLGNIETSNYDRYLCSDDKTAAGYITDIPVQDESGKYTLCSKTCDVGYECNDETKKCVEPITSCDGINSCTDYKNVDLSALDGASDDWTVNCGNNENLCKLPYDCQHVYFDGADICRVAGDPGEFCGEYTLYGLPEAPKDTYTLDSGGSCWRCKGIGQPPNNGWQSSFLKNCACSGRTIGQIGTYEGEILWTIDGSCYKCTNPIYPGSDRGLVPYSGQECGCWNGAIPGVTDTSDAYNRWYKSNNELKWVRDNGKCYKCTNGDWILSDECEESWCTENTVTAKPDETKCIRGDGEPGGNDWIKTCKDDAQFDTGQKCDSGCTPGEEKTADSCECTGDDCYVCDAVGDVPGRNDGEFVYFKRDENDNHPCKVCDGATREYKTAPSQNDCKCTPTMDPGDNRWVLGGDRGAYCTKCVIEPSGPELESGHHPSYCNNECYKLRENSNGQAPGEDFPNPTLDTGKSKVHDGDCWYCDNGEWEIDPLQCSQTYCTHNDVSFEVNEYICYMKEGNDYYIKCESGGDKSNPTYCTTGCTQNCDDPETGCALSSYPSCS